MICNDCINQHHSVCVNDWRVDPDNEGQLIKRDESIRSCACQHRKSAVFVKVGSKENKDTTNGDGSQP